MKHISVALFLTLIFSSCSTVNLKARKGMDVELTATDYEKLKGSFSNTPIDTAYYYHTLYRNFRNDTTGTKQKQYTLEITPVSANRMTLKLSHNDVPIKTLNLKGKFKNGYFRVKRKFSAEMLFGPIWGLTEHLNYIGLSKENNLVVFDSGGVGFTMVTIFPFFVAGGDRYNHEYLRIK